MSAWLEGRERVTVFATYAALGLGVLERAHAQGLGGWDLVVVDEAHRTSGAAGKAWGAVHDNGKVPALRRVYMTATPRLWEVPEADGERDTRGEGREAARVVASMDDEAIFGPVVYRLSLSDAIDQGGEAGDQDGDAGAGQNIHRGPGQGQWCASDDHARLIQYTCGTSANQQFQRPAI
ncbi:DEAD/DEAH box helicase family protein [Streptomyces sp. NBC_00885]|uniref:DEAD/DEAH box helicase family protein n=1 Tax=Streptomyces sp. NBC_00885 TaxID=2975857 RepID=UPI00386315EB